MKLFFPILCLLFLSQGTISAQILQKNYYLKQSTIITINPIDNSFSRFVDHRGICPPNNKEVINIYHGELDQLEDFKASYTNAKQKQKSIKKKQIATSSALSHSFYSGFKKLSFFFEPQDQAFPFQYSYKKTTSDLMFLSTIALYRHQHCDTFYFELIVPEDYALSYKFDSLHEDVFSMQVQTKARGNHYIFSSTKDQRKGITQKNIPKIRLLVYAKDQDPDDYFNDWYFNLVKPHSHLSEESLQEILAHTKDTFSTKETIASVFNFVKEKINYIDFENGIGAVQPRDVNQVLLHKQGDCKDMSNLLCQALKHLGYEAYLAISSTLSHPYDLTFSSLASADHVICVVKLGEEWLFLDATEDYGLFGFPSRQIQDKHIFIINSDRGQLKKIAKIAPKENAIINTIQLSQQKNTLQGKGKYLYHGLSQIDLQFLKNYTSTEKINNFLRQSFEKQFSNTNLSSFQLHTLDRTTQIDYTCSVEKIFTTIGAKTYLSLGFLPAPHELPSKLPEEKTFVLYESQYCQLNLELLLEEAVHLQAFEDIDFAENGIRFQLKIKQLGSKKIQLQYLYENEHVKLNAELIKSYNKANQLIQECLQKSIIYEKPK